MHQSPERDSCLGRLRCVLVECPLCLCEVSVQWTPWFVQGTARKAQFPGIRYLANFDFSLASSSFLPNFPFRTVTNSSETIGPISSEDSKVNAISAQISSADSSDSTSWPSIALIKLFSAMLLSSSPSLSLLVEDLGCSATVFCLFCPLVAASSGCSAAFLLPPLMLSVSALIAVTSVIKVVSDLQSSPREPVAASCQLHDNFTTEPRCTCGSTFEPLSLWSRSVKCAISICVFVSSETVRLFSNCRVDINFKKWSLVCMQYKVGAKGKIWQIRINKQTGGWRVWDYGFQLSLWATAVKIPDFMLNHCMI